MDALAISASGIRSAEVRMAASAHNVANLGTPSFRPLRTVQRAVEQGGSLAEVSRELDPRPVDLTDEVVSQIQASLQFHASLRALSVASETRGSLIDLFA